MRIDNPSISGSLSFIGGTNSISPTSVSLTGSLSGTFEGSFSSTATANISGAFDSVSQSLASDISLNRSSINSLNAASSSYLLNTTDTLDGDLTVTGKITAQEFHTEFVSASIIYQSGSTKFGDSSDDVHQFTGSLNVTGSITGETIILSNDSSDVRIKATSGNSNYFIGNSESGQSITSGQYNIGFGTGTLRDLTSGNSNIILGYYAGFNVNGSDNIGIGPSAIGNIGAGSYNVGIGVATFGNSGASGGSYRIGIGFNAGANAPGNKGIYIGYQAGSLLSSGTGNVIIGGNNGSTISGTSNNVVLADGEGNIKLQFDGNADAHFTGNVGIGTTSTSNARLSVRRIGNGEGNAVYPTGSWAAQIFTSQDAVDHGGLVVGSRYADNDNIVFQAGNLYNSWNPFFTIKGGGSVGIGTTTPSAKLHIKSTSNNNLNQVLIESTIDSTSTNPDIALFANSPTPANNDNIGSLWFYGKNSAAEQIPYSAFHSTIINTADGLESGALSFYNIVDGSGGVKMSLIEGRLYIGDTFLGGESFAKLHIDGTNTTVLITEDSEGVASLRLADTQGTTSQAMSVNYDTADNSFYFKRNETTTEFYISSTGNIGIGTDAPVSRIHILGPGLGPAAGSEARLATIAGERHYLDFDQIRTANSGDWDNTTFRLQQRVDSTNMASIDFTTDASYERHIDINTASNSFNTRFTHQGNVGIGSTSPSAKLDVAGKISNYQNSSRVEYIPDSVGSAAQNQWYSIYSFGSFELTCFFLMVGYEQNSGDSLNRTAVFIDAGGTSYGTGFSVTRLGGSTDVEARRSGDDLQIRVTHNGGGILRWNLIRIDGN